MKSLVIAEKPSVARDIARVFHCNQKGNGVLEGKDYAVTWALGHLVTLADPEEYDKKHMKWDMQTLPMMPDKMKLVVIRQTSKQYQAVKTQLFRKDIGDIIIATDAGREGELVARWILDKSGCHKPIRRLWISSVTDKAIKDGFQNLKDGREYNNLYRAAVARAEADWLVGINGTRALTCKYNAQLSCGRVQTPTLAIIAMREEEIRNFKPKDYYGISLQAGEVQWTWKDPKSGSFRTFQKERAEEITQSVQNGQIEITAITKKPKKTMAPGLYDLTTLQREANQKYGFSAKETLNIMQRLYENHKVLTYPRTDSRYIGKDVVPTLKERLKACGTGPYRKLAGALLNKPIRTNGSFVDDKRVSDHHAIIPDQIEAGTFMFAAAATRGDVTVMNVIPKHLEATIAKLVEIGCEVEEFDDAVRVVSKGDLHNTQVKTLPYPGYPTDMQPQIAVTLALAEGTSIVTESIFENRFKYADELSRMGACIKVEGNSAIIDGVNKLTGARVSAPDLRAGAALVIAGLAAEGITIVDDIVYIQRGYENFEEKLRSLGAEIERVSSEKDIQKFRLRVG